MAKVGAAHGIRGWVRLQSFADPAEGLTQYRSFRRQGADDTEEKHEELRVRQYGRSGGRLIACFVGCDDRESAERLRGAELSVRAAELPALKDGEYYWHELVGMAVEAADGQSMGTVHSLMSTGAQDVLVVENADARYLIPWAQQSLGIEVDRSRRQIRLQLSAEELRP